MSSSYFTTTTTVTTTTALPPTMTLPEILSILHSPALMLTINPLLKSATPLPTPAIHAFYKSVPASLKPTSASAIAEIPVYACVETSAPQGQGSSTGGKGEGGAEEQSQATWRGGWSKRFIPDEIVYETSMQRTPSGMIAITQAPMGVHSVTTWKVTSKGKDGSGNECVLEKEGRVTSNKMLMSFIKTTLQGSYDKLAKDFVAMLMRELEKKKGEGDKAKEKESVGEPASGEQVEVEA
ncbi:hypothetical protein LHYA1_G001843 [Lachnellula hyalina]|uniref:DUF7053 domain-containing protein n=1 Tax=Lachnellula hyalina TaxID=1316788 RepID=A0A8H8R6N6_9HELO|nr:uncharacterized protein LHYA1_G001843 [Lachnellula hyalina]TVY29449.1 hypothetical protein LHYA1_G001843 [Lachnellula hyalina]